MSVFVWKPEHISVNTLPGPLRGVAQIALADELRPEAASVLQSLSTQGIAFKVISGDNPETVRGTVSHLDLPIRRAALASDRKLRWLSLAVVSAFVIAMYWPFSARFFDLTMFTAVQWLQVAAVVLVTAAATLVTDQLFAPRPQRT